MAGVAIGVDRLTVWPLTKDPDAGEGLATYGEAKRIPGTISIGVNPNASTDTLYADDGPFDSAGTQGGIEVEINTAYLSLEMQAFLLGHTYQDGKLLRRRGDNPIEVAIAYRSLKSNGAYRYTTLAKGKFTLPEETNETRGDSINWNTPTIKGAFVMRTSDGEWQSQADSDSEDPAVAELIKNWFNNPHATAG